MLRGKSWAAKSRDQGRYFTSEEVAVRELGEHAGVEIGALVPTELGAGDTPSPLVTGARMGIAVVDGDYAGRAVPEEVQGTPSLHRNQHPAVSMDTVPTPLTAAPSPSPQTLPPLKILGPFDVSTIPG